MSVDNKTIRTDLPIDEVVRRCKSHDYMVDALEIARWHIQWLAVEEARHNSNPNIPYKKTDRRGAIAKIDEALKMAKGE